MYRGNMWIGHMSYQTNTRRSEAGVFGAGAIDRTCKLGREISANSRHVYADLFEDLAFHQTARTAARI